MRPLALLALLPILCAGCGGARAAPDAPLRSTQNEPIPAEELGMEEVQAILVDGGATVTRHGQGAGGGPRLLLLEGEPKVILTVNTKRGDIEMAILYDLAVPVSERVLRTLNTINQKFPCQASLTEDGKLLFESYYPFDRGVYPELLFGAVKKFQHYGLICAVQVKDIVR